jgi:hypothetical protein
MLTILVTVVVSYLHLKFGLYSFGSLILWGGEGLLAFFVFAMPYVALSAWVSSNSTKPIAALALSLISALGTSLFLFLVYLFLRGPMDQEVEWLTKLMPWGWRTELLSGDYVVRGTAYLAMFGFTAVFLAAGLIGFRKKDL